MGKNTQDTKNNNYWPLILIFLMIAAASAVIASKQPTSRLAVDAWSISFMAGFFLVFSGFKLMDIAGFHEGYSQYDLLAIKWHPWGYIYPFVELLLGLGYLWGKWLPLLYTITFLLMGFSSLGVIKALFRKKQLQCSCLGTLLRVPLTTVTLTEDLVMALMGLMMLIGHPR